MATRGLLRLTVPGAISETYLLAAAFIALPVIAAVDLVVNPTVPLNLLYVFPLAFVALHAQKSKAVYLAATLSFLLQLYVLSSYELSRPASLADALMVAFACGMPAVAVRAIRRNHFRAEALAGNAKLAAALESMTEAVVISDTRGVFIDFNEAFVTYHRFTGRQECAKTLAEFLDVIDIMTPSGEPLPLEQWPAARALRGESASNADYMLRLKSTGDRWIGNYSFAPIRNENGAIIGSVVNCRDVTEQREADEKLRQSEASLRAFFDNAAVGAVQLDERGRYIRVNSAYCSIVGYTGDELLGGMTPSDIDAPEFRTADRSGLSRLFAGQDQQYVVEKQIARKDGTRRWVRVAASVVERNGNDIMKTAALVTDITVRKEAESRLLESRDELTRVNLSLEAEVQSRTASLVEANRQLSILARVDTLTGIPNRLAANERLRQEFVLMKRMKQPYSLLMIDIDHFKAVNDAYGHEVGDRVLREVAQRLRKDLRESDFIGRFGGEEFLAVLPATAMAGGLVVASKLRQSIADCEIEGVVRVTISIGVSVASPTNNSEDEALNNADDRLYEAKAAGRNRVVGNLKSKEDLDAKSLA